MGWQTTAYGQIWPPTYFVWPIQMVFTFFFMVEVNKIKEKWLFQKIRQLYKTHILITVNEVIQEHYNAFLFSYHPWLLLYDNGRAKQLPQRTYDLQSLIFTTWPL